jgi:hypothetical protein
MSNSIEKMKASGHVIERHPGAEADIPALNKLLQQHEEYIDEIEFTMAKKVGFDSAQFIYEHPETFSDEEADIAKRIVSEVKNKFMGSK